MPFQLRGLEFAGKRELRLRGAELPRVAIVRLHVPPSRQTAARLGWRTNGTMPYGQAARVLRRLSAS